MRFDLRRPCPECPFRRDGNGATPASKPKKPPRKNWKQGYVSCTLWPVEGSRFRLDCNEDGCRLPAGEDQ